MLRFISVHSIVPCACYSPREAENKTSIMCNLLENMNFNRQFGRKRGNKYVNLLLRNSTWTIGTQFASSLVTRTFKCNSAFLAIRLSTISFRCKFLHFYVYTTAVRWAVILIIVFRRKTFDIACRVDFVPKVERLLPSSYVLFLLLALFLFRKNWGEPLSFFPCSHYCSARLKCQLLWWKFALLLFSV